MSEVWVQVRGKRFGVEDKMSKRERREHERRTRKEMQEQKRVVTAQLEANAINPYYTKESRLALLKQQQQDPIPEKVGERSLVVGMYSSPSRRARTIIENMYEGIKHSSEDVPVKREQKIHGSPETFHAVVFYGLRDNLLKLYLEYRRRNVTTLFFDMGYWGRGKGEMLSGYHRMAINALQPNAYFWSLNAPTDRFQRFRLKIQPWRKMGREVFIAGLSDKNAGVLHKLGLIHTPDPTKYAEWMRDEIRKHTDRPIAYRPKPSWKQATQIKGTRWAMKPGLDGLLWEMRDAWAIVTFRSNMTISGLLNGIPCFVVGDGVAGLMGHRDLSRIEAPLYPDNREQFFYNLAYCQWHFQEMKDGEVWRWHKKKGLIPS